MNIVQALVYFLREASSNLVRSWKVSVLAVLTIAIPLFVGGVFLLVTGNLDQRVEQWQREARVIVYLESEATAEEITRLAEAARSVRWVTGVEHVSREEAGERFQALFPNLADLVEGRTESPLPASLEIAYRSEQGPPPGFEAWLEDLGSSPAVEMVDDDRDWLGQLKTLLGIIRAVGLFLGAVLLGAAVFTIASIIRLTAYLYRDEIAIMRLVGATEFFIRGPFYMEGLLQGVLGGTLAVGALFGAFELLQTQATTLWQRLLTARFLTPGQTLFVILLGGVAGLLGALTSLRRELVPVEEGPGG